MKFLAPLVSASTEWIIWILIEQVEEVADFQILDEVKHMVSL